MKKILLTTILACSGILSAQTPAFVSDWEGAPDEMKIRENDHNHYIILKNVKKTVPETKVSQEKIAKKEETIVVTEEKESEHLLGKR